MFLQYGHGYSTMQTPNKLQSIKPYECNAHTSLETDQTSSASYAKNMITQSSIISPYMETTNSNDDDMTNHAKTILKTFYYTTITYGENNPF
jgi:hypothetical protein